MSKLESISSNPTIREYAQGAAQSAQSSLADFIAPTVPVATSVGRYKEYDQKNRFRIPSTLRALGGNATQVGFDATDKTYNCSPHALDFPIDNLEALESDDLENMFQEAADMLADIAALAHEKTVVDSALAAAGGGTALDTGANDDVIDQLDGAVLNIIKAAKYGGLMGVGIAMGAGFWRKIKNHKSVISRFTGAGSRTFANPSVTDLGELLIAKVDARVSLMVVDDAPEGKDEDINFILDNSALLFARKPNPTRRDPSFMKTFRLRNQWMVPGSYMKQDGRGEVAKFDWSEDVKVTNSSAVTRFNVT